MASSKRLSIGLFAWFAACLPAVQAFAAYTPYIRAGWPEGVEYSLEPGAQAEIRYGYDSRPAWPEQSSFVLTEEDDLVLVMLGGAPASTTSFDPWSIDISGPSVGTLNLEVVRTAVPVAGMALSPHWDIGFAIGRLPAGEYDIIIGFTIDHSQFFPTSSGSGQSLAVSLDQDPLPFDLSGRQETILHLTVHSVPEPASLFSLLVVSPTLLRRRTRAH